MSLKAVRKPEEARARSSEPAARSKASAGAGPARRPGDDVRIPRYLRSELAGEIDLSKGRVDPAAIAPDSDGKVTARLPGLAAGELELEETAAGYRTRGNGYALPLTVGPLSGVLGDSLVLVVRIENNVITGYAAVGAPGRAVPKGDSALFRAIEKSPEALGWAGLSKVSVGTRTNALEGGSLKLGAESLRFTLGGFVEGSGSFSVEGERVTFSGSAEVKLPGASTGKLEVNYSPETGLAGETHLEVGVGKVSGGVDARLRQGVLDIQGTAGYAGDRLKGSITLVATDAETAREITRKPPQAGVLPGQEGAGAAEASAEAGPAGMGPGASPITAKPGPRALCGWGELDFSLTEWLTGKAKVVVGSTGEATVQGEIAPPNELILFEQKEWTKSLLKLEARAAYGLPVVGNVFVFANVGLEALATIGPGKLYNIKLSGQYSTDERVDKELNLQATLNISAFAGLRLRAEGGVGVELLGHDIKAGVGVWALAGVRGYVEATPTIGYRQKAGAAGEFYIQGHMELAGQPFLGLGGDLFVEVDSPWWSPLPDDKWTWPLGSLEYPLPGEFGIGADVEHVLGSKQWPEVKFTEVEFDGGRFMSDLLSQSAPGKSKGGEGNKPAKWDEGGAAGSPAGGKGASMAPAPASDSRARSQKGSGGPKPEVKAPVDSNRKPKGKDPKKRDEKDPRRDGKDPNPKKGSEKESQPGRIGEVAPFGTDRESHHLFIQNEGKRATLMVASTPQPIGTWLAQQEATSGELPGDRQSRMRGLLAQARALASTTDRDADEVASSTGGKTETTKKNDRVKHEQRSLSAVLRQVLLLRHGRGGLPWKKIFSMGGSGHTLIVKDVSGSLEVWMASREDRLQSKASAADRMLSRWKNYIDAEVGNQAIKEEFEVLLVPIIKEQRDKLLEVASEQISGLNSKQFEERLSELEKSINGLIQQIVDWGKGSSHSFPDLSDEAVNKEMAARAEEAAEKAWRERQRESQEKIEKYVAKILELDPQAKLKYRGGLAKGRKGVSKGFKPFDPWDFDIDLFIESDKLFAEATRHNPPRKPGEIDGWRHPGVYRIMQDMKADVFRITGIRASAEEQEKFKIVIRTVDNVLNLLSKKGERAYAGERHVEILPPRS